MLVVVIAAACGSPASVDDAGPLFAVELGVTGVDVSPERAGPARRTMAAGFTTVHLTPGPTRRDTPYGVLNRAVDRIVPAIGSARSSTSSWTG